MGLGFGVGVWGLGFGVWGLGLGMLRGISNMDTYLSGGSQRSVQGGGLALIECSSIMPYENVPSAQQPS